VTTVSVINSVGSTLESLFSGGDCAVHESFYKPRVLPTLITQCSLEARQTVTLSCDVMTWSITVDTLWTGLTAAVTKVTW